MALGAAGQKQRRPSRYPSIAGKRDIVDENVVQPQPRPPPSPPGLWRAIANANSAFAARACTKLQEIQLAVGRQPVYNPALPRLDK